jgi:hypothetical protein
VKPFAFASQVTLELDESAMPKAQIMLPDTARCNFTQENAKRTLFNHDQKLQ